MLGAVTEQLNPYELTLLLRLISPPGQYAAGSETCPEQASRHGRNINDNRLVAATSQRLNIATEIGSSWQFITAIMY